MENFFSGIGAIYIFVFIAGIFGTIIAVMNNKKKIKARMDAAKKKQEEKEASKKAQKNKSAAEEEYERILAARKKTQSSPYPDAYSKSPYQDSYSKSPPYKAPQTKTYEKKFAKYYGGKMAERSFTVVKSSSYKPLLKTDKFQSFIFSPREANGLILLHSNSGMTNSRGSLKNKNIRFDKTDYFRINEISDNSDKRL